MPNRIALVLLAVTTVPLAAQWLNYPTPGLPRTRDGKPNLSAPAPRGADGKPDLSGLWLISAGPGYLGNITADLKPGDVQPWADELYRKRVGDIGKDDPWTVFCLPAGPRQLINGGLTRIMHTPLMMAILYEGPYRQIFLDGRKLPEDPNPNWMGYSVGHWDGDTLVVESAGFNDRSWLDMGGHPHTESLRTTERFHRRDFGHMDLQVTFDDPRAYAQPWTVSFGVSLAPDTDLLEYVCNENERDRQHLIGRTSEEKQVKVAPEILARYVGTYEVEPGAPTPSVGGRVLNVTLSGGELLLDMGGKGRLPLIPLSETSFTPRLGGTYEFVSNNQGVVTHLLVHSAEEAVKAIRRK
jgi:hypothetical protein